MRARATVVVGVALILGASGRSSAQTFPTDGWVPLACGTHAMTDLWADENGSPHERDIVGDLSAPAGFAASDASHLFFRLRLDSDPAPTGKLRQFAWGVAISTDGDTKSYDLLVSVNGRTEQVELYRNTATTLPDDPADPADTPPVQSFDFSTHGRTAVADTSGYGGDDDYFLDMAVPWSALNAIGLTPATPVVTWAGSSDIPNALDGDLACHDSSATSPALSGAGSASASIDPNRDSDGDGYPDRVEIQAGTDPNDRDSTPSGDATYGVDLEGGGGCAAAPGSLAGWAASGCLFLPLLLALLSRRTGRPAGAPPRGTTGSTPRS